MGNRIGTYRNYVVYAVTSKEYIDNRLWEEEEDCYYAIIDSVISYDRFDWYYLVWHNYITAWLREDYMEIQVKPQKLFYDWRLVKEEEEVYIIEEKEKEKEIEVDIGEIENNIDIDAYLQLPRIADEFLKSIERGLLE